MVSDLGDRAGNRVCAPVTLNRFLPARIAIFLAFAAGLMGGCTTDQLIRRPDGSREYVIACGARLGWNICHERANELCPTGYNTLSQDAGFNHKELTIACPDRPAASVQSAYAQCTYKASLATVSLQRDREVSQDRLFRQCMTVRAAGAAAQ